MPTTERHLSKRLADQHQTPTKRQKSLPASPPASPPAPRPASPPITPEGTSAARARHQNRPLNTAEFAKGQVIAADLTNFQVCARGSYTFRPWLNLIVGPNGSGKSTVVTALYLLFNGDQKDTARASANDFIRIGCHAARATAWVMGPQNRPLKISLLIETGALPRYEINDTPASTQEIEDLCKDLNIQVNNRCQFLPQERVATFSAESAHQRLISTLESVGEAEMVENLAKLIEMGEKVRAETDSAGENGSEIDTLTAEREKLTATVERLRQTHEEKKELRLLNSVNTLAKFREAMDSLQEVEAQLESAEQEEREFRHTNSDLFETRKRYEAELRESSALKAKISAENRSLTATIDRALENLRRESTTSTMADIEALAKERDQMDSALKKISSEIKTKRAEIEGKRPLLEPEQLLAAENALEALKREIAELQEKKDTLESKRSLMKSQNAHLNSQRHALLEEKRRESEKRLSIFQSRAHIIKRASALIKENQGIFKGFVHPPPILTMKIKPGADAQINTILSPNNLELFICENDHDFHQVSKLFDENNIQVRIVTSTTEFRPNTQLREKLVGMGFDGVLSDLLEDKPRVLSYLCATEHIDTIPYTTKSSLSEESERAILTLPNFPVRRYLTSTHVVRLNKSKYGRHQTSETRSRLKPNPTWVMTLKNSLEELGTRVEARRIELDRQIQTIAQELELAGQELGTIESDRLVKIQERAPHIAIIKKQKTVQHIIQEGERAISRLERDLSAANEAKETFEQRKIEVARAFGKKFEFANGVKWNTAEFEAKFKPHPINAQIQWSMELEAHSHISRLDTEINGQLDTIKSLIEQLKRTSQKATARVQEFRPKVAEIKDRLGPEDYAEAKRRAQEMSSEEVERAVANLEASLTLNEDGQTFEEGMRLLEQTTLRLEGLISQRNNANSRLSAAQNQLNQVAPEFERKSSELVQNISQKYTEFFSRLGCKGKVELHAPQLEFEKWGIEIKVAFRENEEMRSLSAKTQSGGEKAVATAVYLMALQGSSKAPFFVVDEINQGMDKVNEKAIHRFIVETACIYSPRQYFMVTPKLLPDLVFHKRMKIICHNSSVNVS